MKLVDNVLLKEKEGISYISFRQLEKLQVVNAFTLKGLNFRNQIGMEQEYQKLLSCMGIPYKNLVKPLQKHTDHILVVNEKKNIETADIHLDYLEGIDSLVTNQKNIALATTSADCLCIVLYDKEKEVLANLHSGWRGTFQKIAQKTLKKMKEEFECRPQDVMCFFMPAIRKCHFEVDEDVMEECRTIFAENPKLAEIITKGRVVEQLQKYNIDTVLLNKMMLEEEGVPSENIYDTELCSVCYQEMIHSRRAEGENFGLGTTVVMMKDKKE